MNNLLRKISLVFVFIILELIIASQKPVNAANTPIVIEAPTITPSYGSGMCDSAWYRFTNNRGHYAYLTLNTNNPAQSTNSAQWQFTPQHTGAYKVEAYIPDHNPINWQCPSLYISWDTNEARYVISENNGISNLIVGNGNINQAPLANQWAVIDTVFLGAGNNVKVTLTDLNSEANLSHTVSFSAVRFTLLDDITPPEGKITSPTNNDSTGPGTLHLIAEASDETNGSGVNRVEFWVRYDGKWNLVQTEYNPPYEADWNIPNNLKSQSIEIGIHVYDNQGNRAVDPGGKVRVSYLESLGNPSVEENWISAGNRAYLNQLALGSYGDLKCGGSSVAMILAMHTQIAGDFISLQNTANDAFFASSDISSDSIGDVFGLMNFLYLNYGRSSIWHKENAEDGWDTIKGEIDQNRPVIVLSNRFGGGLRAHYFVVVGYRKETGNRSLIVYDPYGEWQGHTGPNNYNINSTDQTSHKGRWVFYDFDDIWGYNYEGGRVMTIGSANVRIDTINFVNTPSSPPDLLSDEPEELVTFQGVEIAPEPTIYLPIIIH